MISIIYLQNAIRFSLVLVRKKFFINTMNCANKSGGNFKKGKNLDTET